MLLRITLKKISIFIPIIFLFSFFNLFSVIHIYAKTNVISDKYQLLKDYIGNGKVGVWDEQSKNLFCDKCNDKGVPASTLKILTASVFLEHFSLNYRFPTDFFIDNENNLAIKGYGDPFLVSEELQFIAQKLKLKGLTKVKNLVLDASYFSDNLVIPGVGTSLNPYDAANAALAVNFNTIFVDRFKNIIKSAEPQTPLTPFMRKLALRSGKTGSFRIKITSNKKDVLNYSASLFREFLKLNGIIVSGKNYFKKIPKSKFHLFYHHLSRHNAKEIIKGMMKFSNNFTANQLFLITGASVFGQPATLLKSRRVVSSFLMNNLNLKGISFVEGSGISRKNKITPVQMQKILRFFKPYYKLLVNKNELFFKTGTLKDVNAMVGYFPSSINHNNWRTFVIMLHGKNKNREKIAAILQDLF